MDLIIGPMGAGKSSTLISRLGAYRRQGKRVLAVKPTTDDRYDAASICAHTGERWPCAPVSELSEIVARMSNIDVLGIDEVQFLEDAAIVCRLLRQQFPDLTIIVVGLKGDWRAEPWPVVSSLVALADRVTALEAECRLCDAGVGAAFTRRMFGSTDKVNIGGMDAYAPACGRCFWKSK